MALQTTIQNAAASAKSATLNLWSDVTFKAIAKSSYDTATGAVTNTITSSSIKSLIEEYTESQVDGENVKISDLKATILQTDLSGTPDTTDILTYSSKDYDIIKVKQDPANAIWELQLRCR